MRFAKMTCIATVCLSIGVSAAIGDSGKAKGQPKSKNANASAASAGCPPGLAKKNPPCVPPGQAKARYNIGDRIERDYIVIRDPYRYGWENGTYYRVGDYVYRVDSETRKVLNFIGAAAALLD